MKNFLNTIVKGFFISVFGVYILSITACGIYVAYYSTKLAGIMAIIEFLSSLVVFGFSILLMWLFGLALATPVKEVE